jgi:hypothetical protein
VVDGERWPGKYGERDCSNQAFHVLLLSVGLEICVSCT